MIPLTGSRLALDEGFLLFAIAFTPDPWGLLDPSHRVEETSAFSSQAHLYRQTNDLQTVSFSSLLLQSFHKACHSYPKDQIVGGEDAPLGKYPYQVSLRKSGFHSCGGSIVSSHTVLTAAHCIISEKQLTVKIRLFDSYSNNPASLRDLTIHAGTNYLNESGVVYTAIQAITHKNYDPYQLINDVGLLILSTAVEFKPLVQRILLAKDDIAPADYPCILTGWGRLSVGGQIPNNLQQIELKVYDQNKCRQEHMNVQSSHICTLTKTGEGACHGDSGGPLIADGVQIGIVSFGVPCARGYSDVFTRVSAFTKWFEEHVVD
ncbi:chymotrypsin-1-like [Polyergus mexicanus]|uniref:chymotrypsin-1-like n=1 Tax=Polyergus mexicanus TaxID=615972 RepID=UPI0038B590DF